MNSNESDTTAQWQALRRWSADQLELSAGATAVDARSVALHKLAEWEFAPPDRWQQACEILLVEEPASDVAKLLHGRENPLAEVEEQLRQEVTDFAAGFFELPVGPRRDRWRELRDRCANSPSLVWRLDRLESGLTTQSQKLDDIDRYVRELANEAPLLFVLPPLEQAIRRRTLLAEKTADISGWSVAARKLRQEHAEVAALADDYIATLSTWRERQTQLGKAREKARKAQLVITKRVRDQRETTSKTNSGVGFGVMIAIGLISACARFAANNNSSSYKPRPYYNQPQPYQSDPKLSKETQEALRKLLEQANKRRQSGERTPKVILDPSGRGFIISDPDLKIPTPAEGGPPPLDPYPLKAAPLTPADSPDLNLPPGLRPSKRGGAP